MNLPEGDYQTLAGFILEQLSHIPQEGEAFRHGNMRLEVKEMRGVKIQRVEVRLLGQHSNSTNS